MEKKIGYKDIFHQKEYVKIIIAALINRFGDSIDAIASAWIVYELTSNAAWSAIIFGVNKVPSVLVTPLAGAWVEGRKKKTIMVVTDLIRAACVAFVATGYLMGFLQAWMLIITSLIISTAEAFRGPAGTALTPKVLEKEYYEYAMSLLSTLSTIVEIIGTAVAAAIIAALTTAGAIYLDMVTFILSALIILFVNSNEHDMQKVKFEPREYMNTLAEGMRYTGKKRQVRTIVIICVFLNAILVPFNSLQAPLSTEILKGGAEILSILGIAAMAGMLLGSVTYPMVNKKLGDNKIILFGGSCIGIYYVLLVACQPFYASKIFMYGFVAVASALFGYFAALLSSYINVELVSSVEENYLARVAAIVSALGAAATPAVSFLMSIIAVFASTQTIFLIVGIIDIMVWIATLCAKNLSKQEEPEQEAQVE